MTAQDQVTGTRPSGGAELHGGDDLVCPTCGSEVRTCRMGDASDARSHLTLTCGCGTSMQEEKHTGA